MGGKFKTGRAFAFFTIITLILSVSPVFALSCATIDASSLWLLAFCFLLATLFQGLVFVAFASDICQNQSHCRISFGGGLTVAGMVFCILTAYSLLRVKPMSAMSPEERPAALVEPNKQDAIQGPSASPDDSSTHAFDEEDPHENIDERETSMEAIGEGAEEEETREGASDVPGEVDAGARDSEIAPAKGKKPWWSWN